MSRNQNATNRIHWCFLVWPLIRIWKLQNQKNYVVTSLQHLIFCSQFGILGGSVNFPWCNIFKCFRPCQTQKLCKNSTKKWLNARWIFFWTRANYRLIFIIRLRKKTNREKFTCFITTRVRKLNLQFFSCASLQHSPSSL